MHDLEIPNDSTVSLNQCFFIFKPKEKKWFVSDGKYDPCGAKK